MKKLECFHGKNVIFHNLFKSKPKVQFFTLDSAVQELQPIIKASDYKPKWWSKAQNQLIEDIKKSHPFKSTAKCPGIFNLIRHGWILKTWQDIVIKTNGDKQTFEWQSPTTKISHGISFNTKEQLSDFYNDWGNALSCVIKIETPWRVIVPKGYYLHEGPVPYADETYFTTLPGFYSQEYGVAQINVQLKWFALNDEILIPAGTPIAHYMLVPQQHYPMESMVATKEQKKLNELTNIEIDRRFISDKAQSKCIFARLFK